MACATGANKKKLSRTRVSRGSMEFEAFYIKEYQKVFRSAFLLCGDLELSQDATQEAFSRALARWKRLQKEPWSGGWVATTALNYCRKQLRLSKRTHQSDPIASGRDFEVTTFDLKAAIETLPYRGRQATILYYLCDLPVVEVALLMGVSEGAVKAHLSRARSTLLQVLEEPVAERSEVDGG